MSYGMDGRMTTTHDEKNTSQRVVQHPFDPLSEEEIIQELVHLYNIACNR